MHEQLLVGLFKVDHDAQLLIEFLRSFVKLAMNALHALYIVDMRRMNQIDLLIKLADVHFKFGFHGVFLDLDCIVQVTLKFVDASANPFIVLLGELLNDRIDLSFEPIVRVVLNRASLHLSRYFYVTTWYETEFLRLYRILIDQHLEDLVLNVCEIHL